MSLVKVSLIILDALLLRVSASPPNPALPMRAHIIPDWRERFLKSLAYPSMLFRALYWTTSLIEVIVVLASISPATSTSLFNMLLISPQSVPSIQITPLFLLGIGFMLIGTVIRIYCYITLGQLFTFELSIMKNHALITTGPYAYVRHPSYTGLMLTIIGGYLSHLSAGSWVRESHLLKTTFGLGAVMVFVLIGLAVIASLLLRIPSEDAILRRRFGREWDVWAEKVTYRILPLVH